MSNRDHAQTEMLRTLTRLIDGVASDEEVVTLSETLRKIPKLQDVFVRFMQSEAALDEVHSRYLLDKVERDFLGDLSPGEAIVSIGFLETDNTAASGQSTMFRRDAKANAKWWEQLLRNVPQRIKGAGSWAVAASLFLAVCGYLLWPRTYVTLVATESVQWQDGSYFEIGEKIGKDWINIESGTLQLAYTSSAVMQIEGPARFRATGDRDCEVQLGSALVFAPAAAKGFTVETPEMQVVDLGTSFRVDVAESNDTTLQVLEGLVESTAKSGGDTHRLVAGEVAVARTGQMQGLQLASEELLIPQTSNRIAFRAKHMHSLDQNGFKGNDRCYVFMERYNFTLPRDVTVNLSTTGVHTQFAESAEELAAGSRVECYLLHSAPRGKRHVVKGSVKFHGEILGVICSSDKLNATNDLFGSPWNLRCQHPERGLESVPNKNSDRIEISPDRHSLQLSVLTESIDQMRILVASTSGRLN